MKGNKKSKIIVPILMASVATSMMTANVRDFTVFAANDVNLQGAQISVKGFNKTGKVGADYTLPTVTADDGYTIETVLTDPRGAVLKRYNDEVLGPTKVFKPAHAGTYSLVFKAVPDDTESNKMTTTTETMKIEVSNSDYEINLPKNSPYVIMDTIKTNSTVRIPLPELKKDGEVVSSDNLEVTVTDEANHEVKMGAEGYELKTDANGIKYYEYKATTKGTHEIEYNFIDAGNSQLNKSQRFVVKDNFDYSKIKLSMSYSDTKPTTAIVGKKLTLPKVSVVDTNNGSSSIKSYVDVKVFYRGTATNRLETPEEVKVDDFSFTPSKIGDYSVTYQARITYVDESGEHKIETVKSTFEITEVKDSEAPSPKVVNSYKVDENGKITHIANNYTGEGEITEVYQEVSAEATNEEIMELLGSRSNEIPSTVVIPTGSKDGVKVAIPAIYGQDNFVEGSKLTYTRSVRNESGTITTINKGFDGQKDVKDGEIAYYVFNTAGTYTIRYKAADSESNGNSDTISFTVKVVNEADFKVDTPKVNLESFSAYMYGDQVITFAKPSASDKNDKRMNVKTTYHFVYDDVKTTEPVEVTKTNKNGKFEIDLKTAIEDAIAKNGELTNAKQINRVVIKAEATNDSKKSSVVERNIDIINTADTDVPTITTSDFYTKLSEKNGNIDNDKYKQKQDVLLPDFVFADTTGAVLSAKVDVTDPNGNKVSVYNGVVSASGNSITLSNGYFVVDNAGVYNIRYSVKDSGGNSRYVTYGIKVLLTETPTLDLINISEFENKEYQLGTDIFPPKAGIYVNGKYYTPDDNKDGIKVETSWDIVPEKFPEVYPEGMTKQEDKDAYKEKWELEHRMETPEITKVGDKNVSFKATMPGVYRIVYTGSYNNGTKHDVQENKVINVTVKDLTKPEINILENEVKKFPITVKEYVANQEVIIPGFTVTDAYDLDNINRKVEVTGQDGKSITPRYIKNVDEFNSQEEMYASMTQLEGEAEDAFHKRVEDYYIKNGGKYAFTPNGNGTHTVYYVASDNNGNETKTDAQYVYVGDCEKPSIDFGSQEVQNKIVPPTVELNKDGKYEFELNMSELKKYVSDNVSTFETGLTITAELRKNGTRVDNQFGNTNNNNRYKWILDESGDYTLTIKATDKAGKVESKEFTIEAKAKESKETKVTEVVGIILIVLSLAVLAGVIVYFIVSGRKMRPGATKKVKKNNKK